ncbi:MAG: ABC transporter permease [Planctomycetes bacterium]|nr:ABC transporter permease [Planctomycetota bacterium]
MNKILVVAFREFIETVKTRAFFIGVILMPGLIVGAIFLSNSITEAGARERAPKKIMAVLDQTGSVFPFLEARIRKFNDENPQRPLEATTTDSDEAALQAGVRRHDFYAYIVIPTGVVADDEPCRMGRGDSQLQLGKTLERLIGEAVKDARFAASDPPIDRKRVERLEREVPVTTVDITTGEATRDDSMTRLMAPFFMVFLLYMGTFGISMGLLTSVLEEKSSRVVELLLAALSPTQLMAGKILGISVVGLVVLATWSLVGWFGARAQHMEHLLSMTRMTVLVLYFIPGFLFMAAVLAGIGAACNTLKEAQSLSSPLTIVNIVPMMLWFYLSQYPHTPLSVALSFIPPITPMVMVLRVCADPAVPIWQIVATLTFLWASVFAAIWAAGKIFRVGVLMYGKPPTLRELARWVRFR